MKSKLKKARSGTFVDNLKLPVHRWFRYSAGFSAEWVAEVVREKRAKSVLDPFVGSGTTLLAADSVGIPSLGFESHDFVYRIAKAKISWDLDRKLFVDGASELVRSAKGLETSNIDDRSSDRLLGKMYSADVLDTLERLRTAYCDLFGKSETNESRVLWLGITSILRTCSHAGTAQWQYVLPKKRKQKTKDPFDAFNDFCDAVFQDTTTVTFDKWRKQSEVTFQDARKSFELSREFDLLITSPPYPNNYDYADATRLEMTFWKEIEGWKDLQSYVRKNLLRSCSQHSAAERLVLDELLNAPAVEPIIKELRRACEELDVIRHTRGGKKSYHTMVAAYFLDLSTILHNLRSVMARGSTMCFVIGDSAPYGVHVPADRWLGELAEAAGFKSFRFEKLRDRNIKWDNRVHKVPLHEGNLWIEG